MIDTAVIMAAGKGTRFGSRTADMPKGFIEFKGKAMIERSIENLLSMGIKRIIIGTGYHSEWYEALSDKYPQITTVFSHRYAETNSMETLFRCKEAIGNSDFLLLESDIIYEPSALRGLLDAEHENVMLVTEVTKFQDQYYIAASEDGRLLGCSTDKEALTAKYGTEPCGELVGIHRISNLFYRSMIEDYEKHPEYLKRGYEYQIEDVSASLNLMQSLLDNSLLTSGNTSNIEVKPIFVFKLFNLQWYEIDDESDLEYAEKHIDILRVKLEKDITKVK